MVYLKYDEQLRSHLQFLQSKGLAVEELEIDIGFVRCRAIDQDQGRGEYAYKTIKNSMNKPGMVGLVTLARGYGGIQSEYKTYGLDGDSTLHLKVNPVKTVESVKKGVDQIKLEKCRYIWSQAKELGQSDYIDRKGVGAYGVRFLKNKYGNVAVVPMRNFNFEIMSLQFLNPSGEKRFIQGLSILNLFHALGEPKNSQSFGIAESYATAATCFEVFEVSTICAFSAANLPLIAKGFRERFSDSRVIIFADNDRHLDENKGLNAGKQAIDLIGPNALLACPDFGDIPTSHDASDWNDLFRLRGREKALKQITSLF